LFKFLSRAASILFVQTVQLGVVFAQRLQTRSQVLFYIRVIAWHETKRQMAQMFERVDLNHVQIGVAVIEWQRFFRVKLQLESVRLAHLKRLQMNMDKFK
jgi:hypothetical protein